MCFSATSSITAGVILGGVGLVSILSAKEPSHKYFAAIPFIFSIQQFCEGALWLSLEHIELANFYRTITYMYLFFAQIMWPTWIPLSVYMLEKNRARKKLIFWLLCIGAMVSAYMAFSLFYYPVNSKIVGYHIQYEMDFPKALTWVSFGAYGAATILSLFLSGVKKMEWLAIMVSISYLAAAFFFTYYITSVWCFFSAIMSVIILGIVTKLPKDLEEVKDPVLGHIKL